MLRAVILRAVMPNGGAVAGKWRDRFGRVAPFSMTMDTSAITRLKNESQTRCCRELLQGVVTERHCRNPPCY